ncbi:hypothetical protein TSUD_64890 [Trifolium subterraneum]|uniref:Uncharacterized protein n=1 Tax=Trifolium subterraneum TaxID=3900 RepID=A0A2Z6N1N8_TRISU|nr:hypothetical protein TSUD_64890 [Trifolium subterraneum]
MFDQVVSQVLGRSAQDLLDPMNNEGKGLPKETLKGGDPSNNEEVIVLDNKLTRRSLSLHDFGEAAAKKSFVPNECTSLLDSVEPPTCKSVGKRTAIVDEIDVSAIKETKIACVKTKNSK